MPPSIVPVAVLSLLASSCRAFAPPRTSVVAPSPSSPFRRRLRASKGDELSGLLREYSESAASASPAAVPSPASDATAANVADAVVSSASSVVVAPPPPPMELTTTATTIPTPPPEVADSALDSIAAAASAAQDAADHAAAAAAAIAVKGAAATKAAAATSVAAATAATAKTTAAAAGIPAAFRFQFRPIVGGVLVPTPPPTTRVLAPGGAAFDASARARENIALIKANFLGGIQGIADAFDEARGTVATNVGVGGSASSSSSSAAAAAEAASTVSAAIASLHLGEYGGWYAAFVMGLIALRQRAAGREDATAAYADELASARERANEAATAAGLAAEGAKEARMLAMRMEKDMMKDGGKALLESSRSKMAEVEKEMTEKEMRALQAEVATLRSRLEKAEGGGKEKSTMKTTKMVKTEIEEEYPDKVVMESDPDEEGRIIEILKLLDEENASKKMKAEGFELKREEEAKFVAAEKAKAEAAEKAKAEAEDFAIRAAAEAAKKAKKKLLAEEAAAAAAAAKKMEEKLLVNEAATTAAAKEDSKKMTKGVETAKAKAGAEKKVIIKKATKSATTSTKSTAKKVMASDFDDWSKLAESTLKRKSVAQLTEYLTGKGATVTHSDGKSMNKAELLEAVKSLKATV